MTMWMDKIDDHINCECDSMGWFNDSITVTLVFMHDISRIESELFYFMNQPFVQCLLHVNVKGVNTLMY